MPYRTRRSRSPPTSYRNPAQVSSCRNPPRVTERQNSLRTALGQFVKLPQAPRRSGTCPPSAVGRSCRCPKRAVGPVTHRSQARPAFPARSTCSADSVYPAHPPSDRTPKRGRNAVGPSPRLLRRRTSAAPPGSSGGTAAWGAAVRGRVALPCSCTPRFLVPGPPFARMPDGVHPPPTRHGHEVVPGNAYPQRRTAIPGAVERPAAFSSVRARHSTGCPRPNGNQSTTPGHLPGTSPYPAVILSGRLRS